MASIALLLTSGIFSPLEAQFGNGYTYRREIDLVDAKVVGSHTNFPFLFSGTLLDLRTTANGGKVENDPNGYDIIFTSDQAGTTQLAHEIEAYDPATGAFTMWVRVESLVATTKIYMFYGNSSIGTFQGNVTSNGVTGVWDNDFLTVLHLHDDFLDATSNGNDVVNSGSTDIAGKIGDGQDFDGLGDRLVDEDAELFINGLSAVTVELWLKSDVTGTDRGFMETEEPDGADDILGLRYDVVGSTGGGADVIKTGIDVGSGPNGSESSINIQTTNWQHVVLTWSSGNATSLYLDGGLDTPTSASSAQSGTITGATKLVIGEGAKDNGASDGWDGRIDEFRISGVARAAQWIETEYNNQDSPSTFYAIGVEETNGSDSTAPDAVSNLATGTVTSSSVDLTWTAPGDDGATGTATTYDIRYSTSTIVTQGDWDAATQASGEPSPQVAGGSESFTVSVPSPSTTYYFAIKTSDEVPNESPLSNVPSTATNNCAVGWVCWDGEGSTNDWSEDANWTNDAAPVSTDFVLFDATSTKDATMDTASTVAALTIDSGYGTGTLTLGAALTNNGDFIQNGATLDLSGQTLTQRGDWTYTVGTTPTDGTVVFDDSNTATLTVTGSQSLANVTVNSSATFNFTIASGDTLTVNGTYTHQGTNRIDIEGGDVHAKGDVALSNTATGGSGSGTLTINGTGTQNLTGGAALRQGRVNNIVIDKATGTLNLFNNINVRSTWTYVQGTIVPGTSTLVFTVNPTITGSHTIANLNFRAQGGNRTVTIAGGTILTATGTVTLDGNGTNNLTLDGGDVHAQGDIVIVNVGTGGGGTATITMNGTGAQALTGPATAGEGKLPNLTVDKGSGSVTLTGHPTVTGTLTLTQGELAHDTGATNSLRVEGATAVSIAAAGTWTNYSAFTSTVTLGGSVANAGTIDFNGTAPTCGDADVIQLRSTASPTQRLWSGAGSFSMKDVDVQDQAGTAAITVSSGTNTSGNGGNWTFSSCNTAPTVASAIADTTVNQDIPPIDNYRDLNAVFTDAEDGSQLTFTIQSNTNSGLVTPTIDADSALDLSFTASTSGSATITVRATDSGALFVDDVFTVTVQATCPTGWICWDGDGSTNDWSEAANWSTDAVPAATDSLMFNAMSTKNATVDTPSTVANLMIDTGYTGTLTLAAGLTNNGDFVQNDGTLDLGGQTFTQKGAAWTYTAGTTPTDGTVVFDDSKPSTTITVTGSHSLANVTVNAVTASFNLVIAGGTTLTVNGTYTHAGSTNIDLDGGDLHAKAGVVITNTGTAGGGTATITMNGTGAQALTGPATTGQGKLPNLAVDKSSGSVTLTGHPTVAGTLTLTQGELAHDTGAINSLTAEGATAVSIAAAGTWTNYSTFTSSVTLGGSVSNAGAIDFNATAGTCGDADVILLRSNASPTQRLWSGAGSFSMTDVDVQDQAGSAGITVQGGNDSGGNGGNWTFSSCVDSSPPDAVTNLTPGTVTMSSVQLSWTAPGDDGSTGTATTYDIRYSTSTITEGNWASATQVSGEPSPQVAGSSESFTVSVPSPGTTYYFAIKTSDEVPNESALSNVPSATTVAAGLNWGRPVVNATAYTTSQSRAMGGTSPNTDYMVIDTVAVYLGAQVGQVRLAVYTGGTEADPAGATLLYDFGTVTTTGAAGWYKAGHPTGIAWPKSTVTWVAFKGDDGVAVYYTGTNAGAGDFQTANPRSANNFSIDATVAYPGAYTHTGWANAWYSIYVEYREEPPAATSAVAEISPNDVATNSTTNAFTYVIKPTIGVGDTGVNRVTVTVPSTFGDPTVTDVKVGGSSVSYSNNTVGKVISVDLTTRLTVTDSIQVLFTSDAPSAADAGGKDFTSTVDDAATVTAAQSTTEGSADSDAGDGNSWTVTTTDYAVAVTPDTTAVSRLPSNGTNYTVDFTVANGGGATDDYDLLTTQSPGTAVTVVSITGTGVTQGSNPDSARVSGLAASSNVVVTVTYSVADVAGGTADTLFFAARSVGNLATTDNGRLELTVGRPNLTTGKAVSPSGTQLPGTDLTYTLTITNDGSGDATGVVVKDSLAVELDFKVGSVVNNLPAGVSATVEYSDDAGSTWTYVPVSAGCGAPATYDSCVTHIRWTLQNDLSYIGPDNTGNVEFVARIQ